MAAILKIMNQGGKRTLVDNPAPTAPKRRRKKVKPDETFLQNLSAQNCFLAEFSEDEVEQFPTDEMPSNAGETSRQWQNRLWETLLDTKDKGRKQPMDYNESSWSKRNL